jgi:hypothetical protein
MTGPGSSAYISQEVASSAVGSRDPVASVRQSQDLKTFFLSIIELDIIGRRKSPEDTGSGNTISRVTITRLRKVPE